MSAKKPAIPLPGDARFSEAVKECLERIMGRRGARVALIPALTSADVTAAPTAAEFNALRADVETLRTALNDLLTQTEDV